MSAPLDVVGPPLLELDALREAIRMRRGTREGAALGAALLQRIEVEGASRAPAQLLDGERVLVRVALALARSERAAPMPDARLLVGLPAAARAALLRLLLLPLSTCAAVALPWSFDV